MARRTHSGLKQWNMVEKSLKVRESDPSSPPAVVGTEAALWLQRVSEAAQWGLSTRCPPDSNPITSNPNTSVTKPRVSFSSLEGGPQGDQSLGLLKHWLSQQMEFRTCQRQSTLENGNDLLVCGHGQNFETSNAITRVETAAIKPKPFIMFGFFS